MSKKHWLHSKYNVSINNNINLNNEIKISAGLSMQIVHTHNIPSISYIDRINVTEKGIHTNAATLHWFRSIKTAAAHTCIKHIHCTCNAMLCSQLTLA